MASQTKTRNQFPLLLYRFIAKRWRTPALLIIPLGLVWWWLESRGETSLIPHLVLIIPASGILLVFYTMLARRAAVICHPDHFTLRGPLYPVAFSYRRVEGIRPVEFNSVFPPQEEKGMRLRLYKGLWGRTAIIVDLKSYPLPLWWLRLWLSDYLFHPKERALVLVVEDWMALTRKMETHRNALIEKRRSHTR